MTGRPDRGGVPAPVPRPPDDVRRLAARVRAVGHRGSVEVRSPLTGAVVGRVPDCEPADVVAAVARAREAQRLWSSVGDRHRRAVVLRYHDLVLERRDELMDLVQLEAGKARRHALEEVVDVAVVARHYAVRAGGWLRTERRRGALPLLTLVRERRRPVGVVGLIAPWNYPLSMAVTDALPAVLAGNAVVLKPAEQTPFTALLAAELLTQAGLPGGVFEVVTGPGPTLGPALIDAVDFVGFTGSTSVGRAVASRAGGRLVPVSLELGGKNAALVLDDADVDRTVEGLARACFTSAGQLCVATERVYVHASLYGRVAAGLAESAERVRLGATAGYDVDMGALASAAQFEKTAAHVRDAVEKGAAVLAGGRPRPDVGPLFYAPTVLAGVTPEMDAFAEETFGPVVSVAPFDDDDHAVRLANASDYGLNASVWTRDAARGRRVAERIDCGTVNVNEGYAAAWGSTDAPMGGMKASGVGRRHGRQGLLKYTEPQTVAVQRGLPLAPRVGADAAPFARLVVAALRAARRLPGLR